MEMKHSFLYKAITYLFVKKLTTACLLSLCFVYMESGLAGMVAYFMSTCNIIMLTCDLFMSICTIIMLICTLSIFVKNYFFLQVNFLTKRNYLTLYMQHNYVHMRLIYVNMQHNYVNMRLIYVKMQYNYVNMRLIYVQMQHNVYMQHNYVHMRLLSIRCMLT